MSDVYLLDDFDKASDLVTTLSAQSGKSYGVLYYAIGKDAQEEFYLVLEKPTYLLLEKLIEELFISGTTH